MYEGRSRMEQKEEESYRGDNCRIISVGHSPDDKNSRQPARLRATGHGHGP